jgi:WD40 repeat protein
MIICFVADKAPAVRLPHFFVPFCFLLCIGAGSVAQPGTSAPSACTISPYAAQLGLVTPVEKMGPHRDPDESRAAQSRDGRFEVWAGDQPNSPAELWDVIDGRLIANLAPLPSSELHRAEFSFDGARLAIVKGNNGGLALYEATTGRLIVERNFATRLGSVRFSLDGRTLYVFLGNYLDFTSLTGNEGGLAVLDAASGATIMDHFESGLVWKFDEKGTRVLETSSLRALFDPRSGKILARAPEAESRWSIDFEENNRFLVAHEGYDTTRVIDPVTGRNVSMFAGLAWDQLIWTPLLQTDVQFSYDGTTAVIRKVDGTASLVRVQDSHLLARLGRFSSAQDFLPPPPTVGGPEVDYILNPSRKTGEFVFLQNSPRLITRDAEGNVALWDTRTGRRIARLIRLNPLSGTVHLSQSNAWLVTASDEEPAVLWNSITGRRIATLGKVVPNSIRFADPDTGQLAEENIFGSALVGFPSQTVSKVPPVEIRIIGVDYNDHTQVWDTRTGVLVADTDWANEESEWLLPDDRIFGLRRKPGKEVLSDTGEVLEIPGNKILSDLGSVGSVYFYGAKGLHWLSNEYRPMQDKPAENRFELWEIPAGEKLLSCDILGAPSVEEAADGLNVSVSRRGDSQVFSWHISGHP